MADFGWGLLGLGSGGIAGLRDWGAGEFLVQAMSIGPTGTVFKRALKG